MGILAATTYDPATAVNKSVATLAAMSAIDSTNLRLTFTAPASGRVLVRMKGAIQGATVMPQILLGILEVTPTAGLLRQRQAPSAFVVGTPVAGTLLPIEVSFVITGLTPATSYTWDAAVSVETAGTGGSIRVGGPNDAVTGNAGGGFSFEIWDT